MQIIAVFYGKCDFMETFCDNYDDLFIYLLDILGEYEIK